MSEISPRPWRKRTFNDGSRAIVSGPGGLGFVCQYSHENGKDAEEAEADGSLIEAAPDLLGACRAMSACAGPSGNWQGETETALRLIEAAIAKAEGRV